MSKAAHLGEGRGSRQGEPHCSLPVKLPPYSQLIVRGELFLGESNSFSIERLTIFSPVFVQYPYLAHIFTRINIASTNPDPLKKATRKAIQRQNTVDYLAIKQKGPQLEGPFCRYIAYHLGEGRVLKTFRARSISAVTAYHLGEGRVLKTMSSLERAMRRAYHLGEGRVLKTLFEAERCVTPAYHLGEGRVLKTSTLRHCAARKAYHLGEGRVLKTPRPLRPWA